jgi:TPR repeat protein
MPDRSRDRFRVLTAAVAVVVALGAPALAGATRPAEHAAPAASDGAVSLPISVDETAREGDPLAQFVAGRAYLIQAHNSGQPELQGRGLAYVVAAAANGFAPAARFAGSLFLDGIFVPADTGQAVAWFESAARMGDADSQRILGDLFASGEEVPQDLTRAARSYEDYLANPDALNEPDQFWERAHRLAVIYADGLGVAPDPARARALWHKAATEGRYPPSQEALAASLARGFGGPKDPEAAVEAYYAAASAYLDSGLRFAIGPETARSEARRLLAEMQRLEPEARLTRRLQRQLENS